MCIGPIGVSCRFLCYRRRSSTRHLPTELIDYIIDFHHSDKKTLKVCSLVCRTWLPASRFHLFRTTGVKYHNVHSFVKLLVSPLPNIASYVNTLHIHVYNTVNLHVFDTIAPYLKDFVAVKSLHLTGWQWFRISEEYLSKEFGRIENMDLTGISYKIYSGQFDFEFTPDDDDLSTFTSRLRFLGSAFDFGKAPYSWLPIVAQLPAVSELDLSDIQGNHLPTIQAMLRSGGTSIHTIKLDFLHARSGAALISDYVDLTHNTNLRSLSILNRPLHDPDEFAAGYGSLSKIFERISSFCVTHLRFDIPVNGYIDLVRLWSREVAEELNRPRFSKLQGVYVHIYGAYDNRADHAMAIREEMSCLENRGVLTINYVDL